MMSGNAKISVVVPVYNSDEFLTACVDSIIMQTYKNIEVILVDDGSTDRSGIICDMYAKADARVRVIHQLNSGVSTARNVGVSIANGEYVGFVDSDDTIDINMYEKLYSECVENNADMAVCGFSFVFNQNSSFEKSLNFCGQMFSGREAIKEVYLQSRTAFNVAWNKLYRRELFSGISFPKGKQYEDVFIMHELFFQCKLIVFVDEPLYRYVQHANSIVNSKYSICEADLVEAYYMRLRFFCQHEISEMISYTRIELADSFAKCRVLYKPCSIAEKHRYAEIAIHIDNVLSLSKCRLSFRELIALKMPLLWVTYQAVSGSLWKWFHHVK